MEDSKYRGGILADEMGLGKTGISLTAPPKCHFINNNSL